MPIQTAVSRLKRRRTKIVATLGPASATRERIDALIAAGVEVFRLNFSHGSQEGHANTFHTVRAAADAAGRPVAVLGDLSGPKIRAGRFRGGAIELEDGAAVVVTVRDVEGEPGLIPSAYPELADDVGSGDRILLDDGNLELRVEAVEGTEIRCRVVSGGRLSDRKGINLPGVSVSAPSLTPKDREDAAFALELGVDFLALSFVRRPEDVVALRELVADRDNGAALVAKIEKPEALERIEEILEVSDGIMVARGDLGVELPPEAVPIAQTQLVDLARTRGKPVIVATQMLESMVRNPRPTRAEVTDVSAAVRSGADAVMLSAETATGDHPVRAVEIMDRVIRETEGYMWHRAAFGSLVPSGGPGPGGAPGGSGSDVATDPVMAVHEAVSRATGQLSRDLMVRAIVVPTRSGWSAAMVAASRPQAPVVAVSSEEGTCRRSSLLWGVVPVRSEEAADDPEGLQELARRVVRETGLAGPGDHILRVWGFHSDERRNVPTLSVLMV
ncbi:MAG: pyruvate kinase [Gemmatimonadota bacterium]|jgi:pyruvate kinase